MSQTAYNTIEDIQARKSELSAAIHEGNDRIADIWHELITPPESKSKGELIANLVSNSVTAIDGFLLVRKLVRNYGFLFSSIRKKNKKQ
ncbi:MAG: hypothetical protein IJ637_06170 [Prevotella sp.]|nr:hypothetical protein [Prevotella sp.]